MADNTQFLHILAAEAQHLVTVSIELPHSQKEALEAALNAAFASDGESDSARAWNEQRALVVSEALERYLLPVGSKSAREQMRDQAEELLAERCAEALLEVRFPAF